MGKVELFNDTFCPILKDNCRSDCQWVYENIEITDDGISRTVNCAMNYIVETLLELEMIDE